MRPVKYWEIIADRLSKAGWSLGCLSQIAFKGHRLAPLRHRLLRLVSTGYFDCGVWRVEMPNHSPTKRKLSPAIMTATRLI